MDYVLIVLLAVLAIIILSGKGSWLIAGYNFMNDYEKQKYNYKRLCRVIGIGLILLDICLIVSSITVEFEKLISLLNITIPFLIVILANTICRKN